MAVTIIGRNRSTVPIDREMSVADLFSKLKLSEQSFVCIRNGVPLIGNDVILPDDDVSLLEVFSGG
ncbi:MAG: hypothetical protein LVQ96_02955 [Thermoplasmatales archaeon]|nr:hypothetical protein [Thermoplasmatales archaeon]MCW6170108.1 hypothetical protein [Thermoplasmatales archaeon]